jgi:hypothetical protein
MAKGQADSYIGLPFRIMTINNRYISETKMMQRFKKPAKYTTRRRWTGTLLFLLLVPLLLNNASCTMFILKEGYKEVKKLEEEHKEKKERQERQEQQWELQRREESPDVAPDESPQRRDHGQWTPARDE